MSHASMLTDAFLSNAYVEDINEDNLIGMGGKLAKEYGKLITALWRDGAVSVAPRASNLLWQNSHLNLVGTTNKTRKSSWHFCWTVCTKT